MVEFALTEKLAQDIQWEAELQGLQVEQLLTKALRYQQQLYRSQRLNDELSWYESQPLDYRAQFVGEFVAVCNHAVIDHDSDRAQPTHFSRIRFQPRFGHTRRRTTRNSCL